MNIDIASAVDPITKDEGGERAYHVASFVGAGLKQSLLMGNRHCIIISDREGPIDDLAVEYKVKSSLHTDRIFIFLQCSKDFYQVRFFERGHEILRCGSGCLAIAHVLKRVENYEYRNVVFSSEGPVQLGTQGETYYFEAEGLSYRTLKNKRFWQKVIDKPILSSTYIGGANDYCLLVVKDLAQLVSLNVNYAKLTQFSKRALIVSAPLKNSFDYALRYFAPQYGKKEDSATGSANAQIAAYWQKKVGKRLIRGVQVSSTGGVFQVLKNGKKQRVIGLSKIM